MSQNLIAAIEIGSQQISAVIGRKEPDGAINIIAAEQEPSAKFVQRGRVFNPDLMTQCLHTLVSRLETTAHKAINQIYVGIGGLGLHTALNPVNRSYTESTKITQEIIDGILDANRTQSCPGYSIIDVLPLEYKLGTQCHTDPVGVMTTSVTGNFLNIFMPTASLDQLENSFQAAKLSIADVVVTPMHLANLLLTDAEKLSGCGFIDMGAQCTTIGIYEGKLLRYLAVLPLGGDNVTRDLSTVFSIEPEEAEELKRRYGQAFIEGTDSVPVQHESIHLKDGRSITYDELIETIEARMSEILQNVAHLIKTEAGYTADKLIGGLVVTGGASNMAGVDKGLIEYTHIRKIRFVKNAPVTVRHNKIQDFNINGTYNSVLSIVDNVDAECCSDERKGPGIFDAPEQGPTPEEIAAEEARKKAAEEEARRKAEEEEARRARRAGGLKSFFKKVGASLDNIFSDPDDIDPEA